MYHNITLRLSKNKTTDCSTHNVFILLTGHRPCLSMYHTTLKDVDTQSPGLEKLFISLQAGQNFPPAGQISLQCVMVSLMCFFIFSLQITKFPSKGLPVLPVSSTPDTDPDYHKTLKDVDSQIVTVVRI